MSKVHHKIEQAMQALYRDKPFYASICHNLSRVSSDKLEAPFGLFFTKRGAEIRYNPELAEMFSVKAIQYHLEHIVAHFVSLHPIRREGRDPSNWNVSTDLVVNQYVNFPGDTPSISEEAPTVEKMGFKKNQSAEDYYDLLEQNNQGDGQGSGDGDEKNNPLENKIDDHSGWEEIGKNGVSKDLAQAIAKSAIHNAMKSCGNIPGEFQDVIEALFTESKIDWRDILSQFVATSQVTTRTQTWKKPNRRFTDQPGFKKSVKPKLLIGIDTSGSVSDEDQKKLLNEVFNIMDQKESEVIVAGYDTRVHTIVRINNFDQEVKIPNTNGGTDFQPLNDLAEEEEPDAILNLTDGYAPDPDEATRPYLWVFLKQHDDHPNYGESLVLDD